MKWLVILLFLPLFSFGQIHSLDWHAYDDEKGYSNNLSWVDKEGNSYCLIGNYSDSIFIRTSNLTKKFHNTEKFQLLKEDVNGAISLQPFINSTTASSYYPKFYRGNENIYLIWDVIDWSSPLLIGLFFKNNILCFNWS